MFVNKIAIAKRKPYVSPKSFAVCMDASHAMLVLSGDGIGMTDGSTVGDRVVTSDSEDNQFVKPTDVWGEEW